MEKDYEIWLMGREKLKKEDQQFDDKMHAEQFKPFRKSVVVIACSARGPLKWKKGPSVPKDQAVDPSVVSPGSPINHSDSVMDAEPPMKHVVYVSTSSIASRILNIRLKKERVIDGLSKGVAKLG